MGRPRRRTGGRERAQRRGRGRGDDPPPGGAGGGVLGEARRGGGRRARRQGTREAHHAAHQAVTRVSSHGLDPIRGYRRRGASRVRGARSECPLPRDPKVNTFQRAGGEKKYRRFAKRRQIFFTDAEESREDKLYVQPLFVSSPSRVSAESLAHPPVVRVVPADPLRPRPRPRQRRRAVPRPAVHLVQSEFVFGGDAGKPPAARALAAAAARGGDGDGQRLPHGDGDGDASEEDSGDISAYFRSVSR